jgi:hypothetical protein
MITKKDIPLNLLKAIEEVAQSNLDIIKLKKEESTFYTFVETDLNSNNFFKIYIDGSKIIGNYDGSKFAFEFKPADRNQSRTKITQALTENLKGEFKEWTKLIREIHVTPSVHDDNFTKFYSDYYFDEFKVVDEDANIYPFNPEQQDVIEIYLESLILAIESSPQKIDQSSKKELIQDVTAIKNTLTKSTKTQVMKSITKVFGKLFGLSKALGKEIVKEARKHLIKKLIEAGIEYGPKVIEILSKN